MSNFRHINFRMIEETDLLDFIEQKHHVYCRSMLELIIRNFRSALRQHDDPEARDLLGLLLELQNQVAELIRKEEESVFPFIRKMLEVKNLKVPFRFLNVNLTESSVRTIRDDHSKVLALLNSLKQRTHHFNPPPNASEILKLSYAELEEFDADFSRHLYREKEFLFPKMIRLEEEVRRRSEEASAGNEAHWQPE